MCHARSSYRTLKSATQQKLNRAVNAGIIKIILNLLMRQSVIIFVIRSFKFSSKDSFGATSQAIVPILSGRKVRTVQSNAPVNSRVLPTGRGEQTVPQKITTLRGKDENVR